MCNIQNNIVEEFSVEQLLLKNKIVIPEIQREYVWGNSDIGQKVLGNFFDDILDTFKNYSVQQKDVLAEYKKKYEIYKQNNLPVPENLKETIEREFISEEIKTNIGFLYTYDPYPGANKEIETAMLIDGQQRMTTIFLMLFYAAFKANRKDDFYKRIRFENINYPAFDFKVRQKTRDYLKILINRVFSYSPAEFKFSSIKERTWHLEEYKTDISISAMINMLVLWESKWEKYSYAPEMFYDFLLKRIYFWHFPVDDTIQGEKLYITMNGRGRSLTSAEIIKAEVFRLAGDENAKDVGKTFEDIYDFFWLHRPSGTFSADNGVQKFLRWVYLLERYEKYKANADRGISDEDVDEEQNIYIKDFRAGLREFELQAEYFSDDGITYDHIKQYFYALKQLIGLSCENYSIHGKTLCDYIFQSEDEKTNLFSMDNSGFQLQAFLFLPLIKWISNHEWDEQSGCYRYVDKNELIRICRYLRNIRSVRNVQQSVNKVVSAAIRLVDAINNGTQLNDYLANGIGISKTICTEEEIYKAKIVEINCDNSLVADWKKVIWKLEDFKFSKIANRTHDSYAIDKLLTTFIANWKEQTFTIRTEHITLLEGCLTALDSFCKQLETYPESVYHWLLLENHLGYIDERSMIVPISLCQLFEKHKVLRSIIDLKGLIRENFQREECDFIKKYWPIRHEIKDKMLQLAIYVSMCRISGATVLSGEYNKFGYWDTPNDTLKDKKIVVWCNDDAPYVFRSLLWSARLMRHDTTKGLLDCHTPEKVESIENKMKSLYS